MLSGVATPQSVYPPVDWQLGCWHFLVVVSLPGRASVHALLPEYLR